MGEKKMLEKERKTPSQKKKAVAPAKPVSRYYSTRKSCSCPSLSNKIGSNYNRGSGGVTKSWISPSSSCGIHQTRPQLVEVKRKAGFKLYSGSRRTIQEEVIEPYSGDARYYEYAWFINSFMFQGIRYAISRQGCFALVEDGSTTTDLGRHRVVPYCKLSKHFREYLLEYDGEIYLVFLLSRASINVVDGVEVHRLDRSRLAWEKVDRLKGDAMFFVEDECSLSISASKLGCSKGSNCVYFTHDRADDGSWFVYDMETSCISPTSGPEIDQEIILQ